MEKNSDIQFRSPEEIKLYQEARLTETLAYLQAHSRFYQQMFQRTFHRHHPNQEDRRSPTNSRYHQNRPATT